MTAWADLRARVATALTAVGDDVTVHDGPVDSVTPPAFILVWPRPWGTPMSACAYTARLQILCVAARIDPTPGYEQLEGLLDGILVALHGQGFVVEPWDGPEPLDIGGLTYQTVRVTVTQPVTLSDTTTILARR